MPFTGALARSCGLAGAHRLPVFLLVFNFIGVLLTIFSYGLYVQLNRDVYGDTMVTVYLVFTVLGSLAYFLVCGVAWVWSAKYAEEPHDRLVKLGIGVFAMALFHDIPLFTTNYTLMECCGYDRNLYFTLVFAYSTVQVLVSTIVSWGCYAYVAAGWIQRSRNHEYPTKDWREVDPAARQKAADASAIRAHFSREGHEPGTEVLSLGERHGQQHSPRRGASPSASSKEGGETTPPLPTKHRARVIAESLQPASTGVSRSHIGVDGTITPSTVNRRNRRPPPPGASATLTDGDDE